MKYCVGIKRGNKEKNAGAKAPDDIISICKDLGMEILWIPTVIEYKSIFQKLYWKLVIPLVYWFRFYVKLKSGDQLIMQHPLVNNNRAIKIFFPLIIRKGVEIVALVHDLTSLRESGTLQQTEIEELNLYTKIICHNNSMRDILLNTGFDKQRLIVLEIFDYLTESHPQENTISNLYSVTVAGNLSPSKCGYIYKMASVNKQVLFNLYGVGVDESKITDNVSYKGSFSPEKLIVNIEGAFGLVWDGDSLDSCQGKMGEYLKYNNPHKTSLYIVSELPIIVWDKSAIADFVVKNNIGIVISDLKNIKETIDSVSKQDYIIMKQNLANISQLLREGYYTKKAIETSKDSI